MTIFLILTITLLVAWSSVKLMVRYAVKQGLVDIPNARSSHDVPTPRGGGLGLLLAIGVGVGLAAFLQNALPGWELWAAALLIAIIGFVDDKSPLPVSVRLGFQLLVAFGIVWLTDGFQQFPLPAPANGELGVLALPLNLIWILGVINIFNFLDGIDGYAGGQALVAGLGLCLFGWGTPVFLPGLIIAAAAMGFLLLNWHPAQIFMGDVGSSTLGFLLACLPFYGGSSSPAQMVLLMALLLWFFLADGAFTLVRRALRGEKIWEAHRSHLYQRLVISGLSHSKVVIIIMSAEVLLLAFTKFCLMQQWRLWGPLVLAFFLFVGYWGFTLYRERQAQLSY